MISLQRSRYRNANKRGSFAIVRNATHTTHALHRRAYSSKRLLLREHDSAERRVEW